jgi:CRP-like cAMP-binding protein
VVRIKFIAGRQFSASKSASSPSAKTLYTIIHDRNRNIKLKTINVLKGQILQRSGELNTKVFKVESGLLRSYFIDNKGKEHIYIFAPENWILTDNCEGDIPCDLFIDALEDSTCIVTEKDFTKLTSDRKSLIKRINVLQKRVIMLMSSSAVERYRHFIETYPDIIQRVPQKMVASYLGITPEALSRVRKEISKNK